MAKFLVLEAMTMVNWECLVPDLWIHPQRWNDYQELCLSRVDITILCFWMLMGLSIALEKMSMASWDLEIWKNATSSQKIPISKMCNRLQQEEHIRSFWTTREWFGLVDMMEMASLAQNANHCNQ